MNNRNPVRQWSITFPQSGDVGRQAFADSFPPATALKCCREEHKEDGHHLHLGIKLKKGISKSKMLKWIAKKWPNDYKRIDVQATRSIECWDEYISKEDPECYVVVEVKDDKKRRMRLVAQARKWLMEADQIPEKDDWFCMFQEKMMGMSSCNNV